MVAIPLHLLIVLGCVILSCEGFYKQATIPNMKIHVPKTIQDLKELLCTAQADGSCDSEPRKIIITKIFDFTSEGSITEPACAWTKSNMLCPGGKLILNRFGTCGKNVLMKDATFNKEGFNGLLVGSNKYVVGENSGGLKGKGLKLVNSINVEISNLIITDINPSLFLGGIAIEMQNAKNVLIELNYFKNIGNNMILTRLGSSTGVTISHNQFDGETPYSFHCDGTHMYLWAIGGSSERVRLEHNTVLNTSGRAPFVAAQGGTKTIVHLYKNSFNNHKHLGAILVNDPLSSVLAEGNVYSDVVKLVDEETKGQVYIVRSESDEAKCEEDLRRSCKPNIFVDVGGDIPVNSQQVLQDIKEAEAEVK